MGLEHSSVEWHPIIAVCYRLVCHALHVLMASLATIPLIIMLSIDVCIDVYDINIYIYVYIENNDARMVN